MNKQEAIEKIRDIDVTETSTRIALVSRILSIVEDIEPQKPIIPQFVADWIDLYKHQGYTLFDAMDNPTPTSAVGEYLADNLDTFARAWLDGYTVKQPKLYTVEIPNPHHDGITVLERFAGDIIISQMDDYTLKWHQEPEYKLTEEEIRKDFEWAWEKKFAKEVERCTMMENCFA